MFVEEPKKARKAEPKPEAATTATATAEPAAEEKQKGRTRKFNHSDELRAEAAEALKHMADGYRALSARFAADGWKECSAYFTKRAAAVMTEAGWYDDSVGRKAKIESLRAQLAALEAETGATA